MVRHPPGDWQTHNLTFSWSSHTNDLKICALVATLLGAWFDRVSATTGWPGVSILWLGEIASLICSFCLKMSNCLSRSVCGIYWVVWADLRYTELSEQIYLWDILGCLSRSVCEISKVVWADLSVRYTGLSEQICLWDILGCLSRSVWNNTRLSEQICLWDILGCLSRSVCEIYWVVWADLTLRYTGLSEQICLK